ncbi:Protein IQ-DOMAIN 1 [Quillaja saponaria]|uniref:Protein IQ-DOMAIN 1 n=1 Tax=Quillaja saponaria TaxID=32244 RepID=A0AAD7PB41_QUISA|nr:Protein IQ-DOMAIN 1 [Quillaja saponaria]
MTSKCWLRTILNLKKAKEDKSKQLHSSTEKVNGSSHEATSSVTNSAVPARPIEDLAATRIQTAFRSFRARKMLHNLKGAVRFQGLTQDYTVREQATTALSYIHSWSRIQNQISIRRLCRVTEARIRQKKLENQLKLDAKLHELEVEWCNGSETMEEIKARIQQREVAAVKRERAMAYAFSHQWRPNCSHYFGQDSYSLCKENWGWSWMERWIAVRPWEIRIHIQPPKPNKLHTQQLSKSDEVTNHPEIKIDSAKAAASNGTETEKGKDDCTTELWKNKIPIYA